MLKEIERIKRKVEGLQARQSLREGPNNVRKLSCGNERIDQIDVRHPPNIRFVVLGANRLNGRQHFLRGRNDDRAGNYFLPVCH